MNSVTYDITAWSLPYAYNVDAYAVKNEIALQPYSAIASTKSISNSTYGYLIKYNSVTSVKVLGELLKQGIKVRYSEKPFIYDNTEYDRGTLIVLAKGNPAGLPSLLNNLAASNDVDIQAVSTGFMDKGPDFGSPDIKVVRAPKIALITGRTNIFISSGRDLAFFEQQLNYPLTLINATDLNRVSLKNYNVLIIPDGNYRSFIDKTVSDKLKQFVNSGGD